MLKNEASTRDDGSIGHEGCSSCSVIGSGCPFSEMASWRAPLLVSCCVQGTSLNVKTLPDSSYPVFKVSIPLGQEHGLWKIVTNIYVNYVLTA